MYLFLKKHRRIWLLLRCEDESHSIMHLLTFILFGISWSTFPTSDIWYLILEVKWWAYDSQTNTAADVATVVDSLPFCRGVVISKTTHSFTSSVIQIHDLDAHLLIISSNNWLTNSLFVLEFYLIMLFSKSQNLFLTPGRLYHIV